MASACCWFLLSLISRSSTCLPRLVIATSGEAAGTTRFIMVIQKSRLLRLQNTAIRLAILSAVRSFGASALQPDFRILWTGCRVRDWRGV